MLKRLLAFSLFTALFLLQCSQSTQPTKPGEIKDLYTVYLTGKVLKSDGSPVASAQVSLVEYNLTTLTNSEGVYLLTELIPSSPAALAKDLEKDTLKVKKDSQEVTFREITQFIDTLPDFYLIQRDIYGSIAGSVTNFSKVEAVIKEANDSIPKVVGLWFNQGVNEYSGFVYFVYTGDLHNYAVYVNLYSVDSLLIGRSETISFPSTAGNIHMPDINPLNAIPIANAGADTVVSINDTILLHGTGRDIFDSSAIRLEWDAGAKGTFVETTTGYMLVIAPSLADSNFRCVLKVTDKDSNKVMDTVVVNVLQDVPQVSIQSEFTVAVNESITFTAQVSQRFGNIVKYRWDNGASSGYDDSTGVTFTCSYPAETTLTVKLEVMDDDGNANSAIKRIVVTNDGGSYNIMMPIPSGIFQMGSLLFSSGSNPKAPVHTVTITSFRMGNTPITQAEYQRVMGSNPSHFTGDLNRPVEMVRWFDAIRYCIRRTEMEGKQQCYDTVGWLPAASPYTGPAMDMSKNGYRLPTEAEWEYACRAGTTTDYYWGSDTSNVGDYVWYEDNSANMTHPVGLKKPNALGLYDMVGNVAEFCWDWYGSYDSCSQVDPTGPATGSDRVLRGIWNSNPKFAYTMWSSAFRESALIPYPSRDFGFRVVCRP